MEDDALTEPVNKKLMFDDLSSPVKRRSFIANPKQPIRLYCRVRPQLAEELSREETPCLHVADEQTLVSVAPEESFAYKSTKRGLAHRSHQFNFTKVFGPRSSQQEVFTDAVTHILKDFLEGQNCLLFSYGVTNSGKTYTVCGSEEDPGILPRVLDSVFLSLGGQLYCGDELKPKNFSEVERLDKAGKKKEMAATEGLFAKAHAMNSSMSSSGTWPGVRSAHSDLTVSSTSSSQSTVWEGTELSSASECSQPLSEASTVYEPSVLDVDIKGKAVGVWVSCAEIYNEFIFDLFAEIPVKRVTRQKDKKGQPHRQALRLAEDKNHNVFIKGLTEVQVTSVEDAMLLAQYGQHNRHVGTTLLNQSSSRSHCVFTIKLIRVTDTKRPKLATINRMSIVDLAGSERSRKTKGCGQVVKEAGSINVSLHILGKCITALRQNQKRDKSCIPFRESKLTQIFQNYFVGKGCGTREGRVTMFVNVSPSPVVFDESLKVLEVSAIASKVVPYVKPLPRGVGCVSDAVSIENAESTPVHEVILKQHSDEKMAGQVASEGDVSPPLQLHSEVVLDDQATPCVVLPEGGGAMAFITPAPPGTLQPACPTCEHYKSVVHQWKGELVELKLQLWEQESVIRRQVCKEFQEQIADIKETHKESMMEQADQLEAMHEQRMELLTKSIKKVVQSKKRRREEEAEEEDNEKEHLRRQLKKLQETVATREKELEDVKGTMKHLRRQYESSMVEQNSSSNDLAIRSMTLEKRIASLEDENTGLTKEREGNNMVIQRLEAQLLDQLKAAKECQEAMNVMQENNSVMADTVRGYQTQLAQARQEAKEAAEQKELNEKLKQVQQNLDKMTVEKRSLADEVVALTHSLEEHRALAAKREAEWAESKEVVRGALEGQLVEVKKQLAAAESELSVTRQAAKESQQAAKEKEEELTELFKKGISSEQFAVMEQKLEKAAATEKALRAEVQMWKTDLNKLKVSSEKELATMRANNELEVGELNVRMRELSHQLQLANSSGSEPPPSLATLVAQPGGEVVESKPVARRTRRKRVTIKPSASASSDSSSAAHSGSDEGEALTTTATGEGRMDHSEPSRVDKDSPPLPSPHHGEHIYDEPHTDCDTKIEDSTHTHLPNIETSSQLLEPDQSLIARKEIDVTYAKLSKAQRKRKPPTTRAGASAATNIPVKCKTAEVEEVFPSDEVLSPSKRSKHPRPLAAGSKQAQSKAEEIAEDENSSTPKTMSMLRKKLGKVMSKSAGRRGKKLTDSTNLGEEEGRFVSPLQASGVPSPRLSRTAGSKRKITKSQISGPLDLIPSPASGHVRGNQPKATISWALRSKGRINDTD